MEKNLLSYGLAQENLDAPMQKWSQDLWQKTSEAQTFLFCLFHKAFYKQTMDTRKTGTTQTLQW